MKIPHQFVTKKDEKLSLSWLDENNDFLINKMDELESRLNAQGAIVAEQVTIILQLNEAVKKLQPKSLMSRLFVTDKKQEGT